MGRFSSVGPPKLALSRIRNRGWESGTKTRQDKTRQDQARPGKTRQDKARQDRERAPCLFRNRYSIQLCMAGTVRSTSYWVLGTGTVRLGDAFVFPVLSLGT
jgi:hypothetical protein